MAKKPARTPPGTSNARPQPLADTVDSATALRSLIARIGAASRGPDAAAAPPKPLPPGTLGQPVPVGSKSVQQLLQAAAAAGSTSGQQVWTKASSELAVITGKIAVTLDDGLAIVAIPVSCDQLSATIQVPFAMGGKDTPAGMVIATEDRPRGNALIVDLWGEALTAYAWKLLLTVMHRVALQSGIDEDGAGLVPVALTATKEGITLAPMARHTFDRVRL